MTRRIAASAGFILALAAAASFAGVPSAGILSEPSLVSLAVTGAALGLGFWSLLTPGYRRGPYWITLVLAAVLIVTSLASGDRLEGSRAPGDGPLALTGLLLIVLSRVVAARTMVNPRRYVPILLGLTAVSLAGLQALPAFIGSAVSGLSYRDGHETLKKMLHPAAAEYVDDIDALVESLLDDSALTPSRREEEIRALNGRIAEMEAELALFEELREENDKRGREIAELERRVAEAVQRAADAETRRVPGGDIVVKVDGEEVRRVTSFAAAVRPDIPMVRDFAAVLASGAPGSYYRPSVGDPEPGSTGVSQVVAIHRYVSSRWKYVNDPLFTGGDYFSPADRTIAAGLVGDCDDYAILMASAIEAVGGRARILGGSCAGGHHAWPEVYIGGNAAWSDAMKVITAAYPGRPVGYGTDASGGRWLCLDWQLGTYTCGESPQILYQSDRR